jgi:predicted nucleotidyltransferase
MTLHPSAPAPYGLPASAVSSILAVLKQVPEIERIWLFGSRAKGNYRPGSDIDLCIDAPQLSLRQRLAIENRLDDLLLPWKIDLVPWQEIDNCQLADHIRRVGVLLAGPGAKSGA